ncbi:ABC transporter substrate-binding protein [Paenibacillus arenilitoris]|uniref:Carbohydrate ABC transporter substrate-binding protein n=1 Tax=Paenibacillus arenilitoris TaxID=2772299 RepID=A0A927CGG2_9BACL|nr:ABC transporter substrate-binding protein [Paenibacillus arenilitoris]MBD2867644.1 carbohydrate ABC transporter substrate-binding protein [Paenibacillus arenilitoris]
MRNRNRWRTIAAGLLLAGTMLATAACGGLTANLNALSREAAALEADETGTIELAITKSSQNAIFVSKPVLEAFEKETGIRVKLQILPTEQVSTVLQTKLAVGETPDLILYNLYTAAKELNLDKNFVALDDEAWARRLLNKAALSYNGRIYGFHLNQDAGQQGIVYNKEIFRELGLAVPRDFEQLLDVCEKIKAAGITPFFMPFNDDWSAHMWISASIADYAKKNDPSLWDDLNGGKRKFADIPALIDITRQQYELYKSGYTNRNVLADSYDMAIDIFIGKKAAMMTMGDWFIADVVKKDPSMELGLFPVPYARDADLAISPLGGQLFIPKKAKHIAEAKRFLEFLASKEQAQQIVDYGQYISNLSDVSTPRLPRYKQEIVDVYIKPGKTVMTGDTYLQVDIGAIWDNLQDMFAGGLTAEEVWENWDEKFVRLMREKQAPGFLRGGGRAQGGSS